MHITHGVSVQAVIAAQLQKRTSCQLSRGQVCNRWQREISTELLCRSGRFDIGAGSRGPCTATGVNNIGYLADKAFFCTNFS